jgi:hypothetical protein
VVLTDSKGKERLDANGDLVLRLDNNPESPSEHVTFELGHFPSTFPADTHSGSSC